MDDQLAVTAPRNLGPSWGYDFLLSVERRWPRWLREAGLKLGVWVALPFITEERRHSREFLRQVLGREPTIREVWRHFYAFMDALVMKMRVARGGPHACVLDPETGEDFRALMGSAEPALFGTFHVGRSDMLGFLLSHFKRRVAMIRLKVGNSGDTERLIQMFGEWIRYVWVNEPENLLFALKRAVEAGESIAMQCDRWEYSAKGELFQFLGAKRLFPFTIYHLAVLFNRPVIFAVGLAEGDGATRIVASPMFRPSPHRDRRENLAAAREHFQGVLEQLERLLQRDPTIWFNFRPLNPLAPPAAHPRALAPLPS